MIAASRRPTAHDVLRRLAALGAHIECRGERIVLRAGARSVPPELIAAAREAKAELSKVINSPKVLDSGEVEHLPRSEKQTARVSAASIEGAQLCESERLPVCLSTFNQSRNDYSAAEALTEDAHLSTLEQGGDFSGSQCDPVSKALNSPHVSGFERDGHLHPNWDDVEEERAAIVELDGEILRDWADGFARLDPARPATCRQGGGDNSSTMSGCSSTPGPRVPRLSAGVPTNCSAATATDLSLVSIKPG
jgi:hypothetical protein